MADREDFLPYYRDDLMEKATKIRKVILNLVNYRLTDLEDITAEEYDIVRLAVINSIKGEIIAHEEKSRQNWVENVFLRPAKVQHLLSYEDISDKNKCDFEGTFDEGQHFGLEVKGGEGNSVTLLHRPVGADIFIVWSFLDVMSNTPAENMRAVLGRVVKQMVNNDEKKQKVDYLVFYDEWYRSGIKKFKVGEALPDAVVFPTAIPTRASLHPTLPNLSESVFLKVLYKITGGKNLADPSVKRHIWLCDIELEQHNGDWYRKMTVRNWYASDITLTVSKSMSAKIKIIKEI